MNHASLLDSVVRQLHECHIEEARLDAELLLAAACGQTRAWLLAHGDEPQHEAETLRFAGFVERRARHEPVAYILGHKEFYGLDLLVDRRVLIPRPETETLVAEALAWLRHASVITSAERAEPTDLSPFRGQSQLRRDRTKTRENGDQLPLRSACLPPCGVRERAGSSEAVPAPLGAGMKGSSFPYSRFSREAAITVLDVGTGSGAIAIALATHTPRDRVRIIAGDVSPDALAVARANAARHGLSGRITFVQSDLLAGIDTRAGLIVANLPYVARAGWAELAPDISAYEPHLALDGGADGLDLFRTFFAQAPAHLAPGGALLLEIGWQQAAAVRLLAQAAFPQAQVDIVQDLAGQDRVALIGPHRPTLPAPKQDGQPKCM